LPGATNPAPPALDELEEVPQGVQSKPAEETRPGRDDDEDIQDRPSRRQRRRDEDDEPAEPTRPGRDDDETDRGRPSRRQRWRDEDDEDDDRDRGRYRSRERWQGEPHRAGLVLTFGIISVSALVVSLVAWLVFAGCSLIFCVIGLGLGIPAWIMGHKDLQKINARIMDPAGKGNTTGGYICGIIGTIGNALVLACCTLFVVGLLAFLGVGMSGMPKAQSTPSPMRQQDNDGALPRMQDVSPNK
jgi:hypothetical protein